MARKFLLTSFDYVRPKDPNISLASSSIMAYLKTAFDSKETSKTLSLHCRQYNVKNAALEKLSARVMQDIKELKPDIIATGVPKYIVLGGPQITYNLKGTLEKFYPYGDFFIRGDTDAGSKSIYNLSELPSPLLTPGLVGHSGFVRWETKRGCPFECAFCQHKDSYEKRLKCSPSRITDEQTWIVQNQIKDISIVDPIFNSGGQEEYLQTLNGFLKFGYTGRLNMQARFEMIKAPFLQLCSQLQENGVQVELEFGIQTIIKKESQVIRRMNNLKAVVKSANELHARSIPFEVSLIYGLPEQTLDSFRSSLEWVKTFVKPTVIRAWPLMLLKGTSLYDMKNVYNLREKMLDEDLEELDKSRQYKGIPHVVESSSFTETEWDQMKSVALSINSENLNP
ncbi:hypothetical protein Ocin01_06922 [Orchesella cincta]|uniref:Radical SAM core domain-containing protein n=1 Tax=Orchesella cincta TaxID=48709 RepID=A0A1D2N3E9_ORCCI|nr:hypothetical protein Ocin01_06922 [Orchesella cincta]